MKELLLTSLSMLALSAAAAFAQSNSSTLNQSGSSNAASIDQTLNDGQSNTSTVNQRATQWNGDDSYNSSVTVTQIGGLGSDTTSKIQQHDSDQMAQVAQNASAGGTEWSRVRQSGGSNTAIVQQVTPAIGSSQASRIVQTSDGG